MPCTLFVFRKCQLQPMRNIRAWSSKKEGTCTGGRSAKEPSPPSTPISLWRGFEWDIRPRQPPARGTSARSDFPTMAERGPL